MANKNDPMPDFERELVALLPQLRRFAGHLAGSTADGDDLLQEALAKALTNRERWQAGTRLDSWMYRIIQNHWIDTVRTRRRRGTHVALDGMHDLAGSDGVRTVEGVLAADRLRSELARLPDDQRVVLLLVTIEGLSYAEAAKTLDIPVGTVMSRISRARASLARKVFGEGETP
jgi:RNA polymerase sigma-70 factor, ECF subfamily